MKKIKKINSLVLLLAMLIVILFASENVLSQCTNTTAYPSTAITAPTNGASTTITTAQWAGEYATINSIAAGSIYNSTSSVATDFLTVRQGSYNGTIIASGITPLNWTATTTGTYYIHCNTNSSCGIQNTNRTTIITNVLMMIPVSGNNSFTVCSGHLYDNGGPSGDYTANNNGHTVIYPGTNGNVIRLTGSYRTENNYDHVYIYNGIGTGGALLLDGTANTSTSIGAVTSTDASGALTVQFVSDESIQRSGFDFTIACIDPCLPKNIPYFQNFESVIAPAIPSCTSVQNIGVGNLWEVDDASSYGFTGNALEYPWNSSYAANSWFYTPGLNLTGGTSYRISFKYACGLSSYPERLKVAYGTSATSSSMTNILLDLPSINQESPQNASHDFTPSATGVYYIGFNAYSVADMFYLFVDDVLVNLSSGLPISLVSFTGECDNGKITLNWTTASETNNNYFTIEKSDDGSNWRLVQKVNGAGNSDQKIDYSIIDQANSDITYYRLTQTDYDGKFKIFPIIAVKCENNYSFQVYPNPTTGPLTVRSLNTEITQIEVKNSLGQTILKNIDNLKTIDLSGQNSGIYLIKITDYENKITIFKIIKE